MAELPRLQPLYEKYRDRGLEIIAIEINNQRELADEFIAKHKLTFNFGSADRAFVKKYFNTAYYPNSFIIGKDNIVRRHHVGFKPGAEAQIEEELLEELDK